MARFLSQSAVNDDSTGILGIRGLCLFAHPSSDSFFWQSHHRLNVTSSSAGLRICSSPPTSANIMYLAHSRQNKLTQLSILSMISPSDQSTTLYKRMYLQLILRKNLSTCCEVSHLAIETGIQERPSQALQLIETP